MTGLCLPHQSRNPPGQAQCLSCLLKNSLWECSISPSTAGPSWEHSSVSFLKLGSPLGQGSCLSTPPGVHISNIHCVCTSWCRILGVSGQSASWNGFDHLDSSECPRLHHSFNRGHVHRLSPWPLVPGSSWFPLSYYGSRLHSRLARKKLLEGRRVRWQARWSSLTLEGLLSLEVQDLVSKPQASHTVRQRSSNLWNRVRLVTCEL